MSKYRSPFKAKATCTCGYKVKGSWAAGYHTGEDWICNNRTLVSPTSGVVSYVGTTGAYGNHVVIWTDDNKTILMAHMASVKVKKGQKLSQGQEIGIMGTTGNSTGVHLHIEVEKGHGWAYNTNLLKPSTYIDFTMTKNTSSNKKEWQKVTTYKNGSTLEYVYQNTSQCIAQNSLYSIGYLNKHEKCQCFGEVDGCYLVVYNANGSKKTGFVKYNGGVK